MEIDSNGQPDDAGSMRVMDEGTVIEDMPFAFYTIVDSSAASINASINSRPDSNMIVEKEEPVSIPSVAVVTDCRPSLNRRLSDHFCDCDMDSS